MNSSDTIWAVGNAEEHPVVVSEHLEPETDDPVPDEEHEREVADAEPVPQPEAEPDQDGGTQQPGQRLVQEQRLEPGGLERERLARVVGDPVGALDRDAPRERRRRTVQLLVEEVAPAGDGLHREQARGDDVGPAPDGLVQPPGVDDQRDEPGGDPAVDPQPRVRRQHDLEQVVLVQRPLVDDVVHPAADERRDGHDDHPVADQGRVLACPAREPDQDLVCHREPDRIADPVPVRRGAARAGRRSDWARSRASAECSRPAPYTRPQ